MMVTSEPGLLTNADATTKMHLEIRNFWKARGEHIFYEFFHVLHSQIYACD